MAYQQQPNYQQPGGNQYQGQHTHQPPGGMQGGQPAQGGMMAMAASYAGIGGAPPYVHNWDPFVEAVRDAEDYAEKNEKVHRCLCWWGSKMISNYLSSHLVI